MTNSGWTKVGADRGGGLEYIAQPNANDEAISIRVDGEVYPRVVLQASGHVLIGDGTAAPSLLDGLTSWFNGTLVPSDNMGVDGDYYLRTAAGAAVSAWLKGSGTWAQIATFGGGGGSGSVATDAIWDAKGDLAVGTGADTAAVLTVGANDTMLMADSAQTTGQKWGSPATVKTALSLGNVTNTSDANKPVSTAQQTALDLKANLASPTFTGTVVLPSSQIVTSAVLNTGVSGTAVDTDSTFAANSDLLLASQKAVKTALALKANLASPTFTGHVTVEGVTATGATGTGKFVFDGTPVLVTPVLGVATATSINGTTVPSSKTLVVTTDTLAVHAATTSAQLAGVLSDETGSGAAVFANAPALSAPTGIVAADIASGTFGVARGGTGAATLAAHGVLIGNATSAVAVTGAGTSGQVLTSNGASADPTFQAAAGGTPSIARTLMLGGLG